MEYTQAELVWGLRNKDLSAYEYLIGTYTKMSYCLAYNILSASHSKEDIEECVADVFFDAWIKIDQFNEEQGTLRTWLLILTKYKALSYKRRKNIDRFPIMENVPAEDDFNLEKLILLRDDQEQVINIINTFPETDREIFIRRFFLGEKISDLARSLNMSRTAVDNRLFRGRKVIKEGLKNE